MFSVCFHKGNLPKVTLMRANTSTRASKVSRNSITFQISANLGYIQDALNSRKKRIKTPIPRLTYRSDPKTAPFNFAKWFENLQQILPAAAASHRLRARSPQSCPGKTEKQKHLPLGPLQFKIPSENLCTATQSSSLT